jgi:hypothetical protein
MKDELKRACLSFIVQASAFTFDFLDSVAQAGLCCARFSSPACFRLMGQAARQVVLTNLSRGVCHALTHATGRGSIFLYFLSFAQKVGG